MPCEAKDVLDDVSTPVVCAEARVRSWDLDKAARGVGWSQDATGAVARGAEDATGHQTDVAEHEDALDSPLDVAQSLVDSGGMVQDAPGQDGRLSKDGVPPNVAQGVLGQHGRFSTGNMLLNVAHDALDSSEKGWIGRQAETRPECGIGIASHGYVPRGRGVL